MEKNYYGHSSSPKRFYPKEEYIALQQEAREYLKEEIIEDRRNHFGRLLLDSSLISQTSLEKYSLKLVTCGEYTYVYRYLKLQLKKNKNLERMKDKRVDLYKFFVKGRKKLIKYNFLFGYRKKIIVKIKIEKKEIFVVKEKNVENKLKEIDIKNINRSKTQLQMLIKANEDKFKTFITLTFGEDIKSIENANEKFNIFRTKVKRIKSDFMYICVPEFTKQGRVHYHMLTNIDYNDFQLINENRSYLKLLHRLQTETFSLSSFEDDELRSSFLKTNSFVLCSEGSIAPCCFVPNYVCKPRTLFLEPKKNRSLNFKHFDFFSNITIEALHFNKQSIFCNKPILLSRFAYKMNDFPITLRYQDNVLQNTKKTYNFKNKNVSIFKTVRYWDIGFSNVMNLKDINIVAYLTKYLTKDIDNRLFGKRRYFYSMNLSKPRKVYLDLSSGQDVLHFLEMATNSSILYNNLYFDKIGQPIFFTEYKRKEELYE